MRKPLQGTWNIIRFNWHFYAGAAFMAGGAGMMVSSFSGPFAQLAGTACLLIVLPTLISLLVAAWIYDFSGLYQLDWLDRSDIPNHGPFVNIHAGFDETSQALTEKFPAATLHVFDFYDPARHTEMSIRRARNAYPAFPGTQRVTTTAMPLPDRSVAAVFLIFAAHEIRAETERAAFFRELTRILVPGGKIILMEHFRDLPNFLAWNAGAFHFLSRRSWMQTFQAAGVTVIQEARFTPFVRILELNHG